MELFSSENSLIHVYGTSHVSEESFEVVDEALEKHDPDIVGLELDYVRLESLLNDRESSSGGLLPSLIRLFQNRIGSKTGVMPGDEMKYAYEKAMEEGREVALVDQDIRVTLRKLKVIRRKEKVKAAFSLLLGLIGLGGRIDVSEIPDEEFIEELLDEMEEDFPELYEVLVEQRNYHIAEALKKVDERSDGDVIAFLGAGHVREVRRLLEGDRGEDV